MSLLKSLALRLYLPLLTSLLLMSCQSNSNSIDKEWAWETLETIGEPTARHEAALMAYKNKLYLIGGRRLNPVDVYDPLTNKWTEKSKPPLELHHFQAVTIDDAIYLIGAMTGGWPEETPLEKVMVYYPEEDRFEMTHTIPEARRRGGAGAALKDGKIYITGGITNGHMDGFRNWLDEYDPETGAWKILPDAPHKRDHLAAAIIDNKLYSFAGRHSHHAAGKGFETTVKTGDVFNFKTNAWETPIPVFDIPTERAGNMAFARKDEVIFGGGESGEQEAAHAEVEAFNVKTQTWRDWPKLQRGRHGTGFAIIGDYVYTASGSSNRGGGPELTSLERLKLP